MTDNRRYYADRKINMNPPDSIKLAKGIMAHLGLSAKKALDIVRGFYNCVGDPEIKIWLEEFGVTVCGYDELYNKRVLWEYDRKGCLVGAYTS